MKHYKKICLTLMLSLSFAFNAKASSYIPEKRLSGENRYVTASEISKFGWKSSSEWAIIATGENFPDALTSSTLAKKLNAPILLTEKNKLNENTKNELKRLNVKKVYLIGGNGVIGTEVENELKNMKISTTRIYGKDRFETSVKIAEKLDNVKELVIVTGEDFPGALYMAPIAAKKGIPIILVPKDEVPDSIKKFVKGKNISKSYIIGEQDLISDSVASGLPNPDRIYGIDRYDRNLAALYRFASEINFSTIYVATGENFPDALAGSVVAAQTGSPIFLVNKTMAYRSKDFIKQKIAQIKNINLLGGEQVVSSLNIMSDGSNINTNSETSKIPDNSIINTIGNSAGNLVNEGLGSEQGSWIYYAKDKYLLRTSGDGNYKTVLNKDNPKYINVIDQWVYYTNGYDDNKIYKIKTDGTQRTCVCMDSARYLTVQGDWIYYTSEYAKESIYKVRTDGTERMKLTSDSARYLNVVGEWIYYSNYSDSGKLYKIKTTGVDRGKLNDEESIYTNICDGWLYYSNLFGDGDLYKKKIDNSERTTMNGKDLRGDYVKNINAYKGWIYYVIMPESGKRKLYRIKPDGTEKTLLTDKIRGNITIMCDKIYFENIYDHSYLYRIELDGRNLEIVK